MTDLLLILHLTATSALRRGRDRLHLDQRGEGVISAAVAARQ